MYSMLARLAIRYRRAIIWFWLAVLLAAAGGAVRFPSILSDAGLKVSGSYAQASHWLSAHFQQSDHPVLLLFENRGSLTEAAFHERIADTLSAAAQMEGLLGIRSPLDEPGMRSDGWAYAELHFSQPARQMKPILKSLQEKLPQSPEMSIKFTGKDAVWLDVRASSQSDLIKAEWIGIPLAFAMVWLAFGGLITSLIPIGVGLLGVVGAFGILYPLGQHIEMSVFVLNVIPMVGLALSIDFALLFIHRFREEYAFRPLGEAMNITMSTAGRTVLLSGLCFLLGLCGMLFIRLPIFYTVVLGAMLVLVLSLAITLTLVPALLCMLANRIDSRENGERDAGRDSGQYAAMKHSKWYLIAGWLIRKPIISGLFALAVLLISIVPLSRLQLAIPDATSLPANYESRQAAELIEEQLVVPGQSLVQLVLKGDWVSKGIHWQKANEITQNLSNDPWVVDVHSIFRYSPVDPSHLPIMIRDPSISQGSNEQVQRFVRGDYMLVTAVIGSSSKSTEARSWVRQLEDRLEQYQELEIAIGGEAKYEQEVFDQITDHLLHVLAFIVISLYLVMLIAFRSIWVPLKTIVINLLTIAASFGLISAIFRAGPFGWEASDLAVMIPVFLFGLTFGISLDYGIFLVSRMAEIYDRTKDNERAVWEGLAGTGKLITSAAAIMIVVTAPFALGEVAGVKQLGVGIAITIFLDATLVRMLLVPSLMKLMGKWNWWFPWRGKNNS